MRVIAISLILVLWSAAAVADLWQPLDDKELTIALAYGEEIANSANIAKASHVVRVFAVPEEIGECWGALESCPDWRLYISISMGDLYETPFLFRFINAKGWKFLGWQPTSEPQTTLFRIATELPGANLEPSVREEWRQEIWEFTVNSNGLTAASIEVDN